MGAGGEGEGKAAAVVRVLVVDDSPIDRKVVELLLRNHKGGAAPFHGQLLLLAFAFACSPPLSPSAQPHSIPPSRRTPAVIILFITSCIAHGTWLLQDYSDPGL
jgi:CheY-like chemotaxis protein